MGARVSYRKEFFDREYTRREAYGRVWKYAKRYKFRLFVGILAGMCTAGTMLPLFQIVRPTLQHVESHDGEAHPARASATIAEEVATPDAAARPKAESHGRNSFDRQMEKKAKLPGWYPQVEQMAAP